MTDISLDLFNAYFAARQNKRNTCNQLKFEYGFESNLLALNDEIVNRKYKPLPEMAFMVHKPVKREIFCCRFQGQGGASFIIWVSESNNGKIFYK
ncbi:MAG: hypothetical protein V4549_20065 [Bacteroidota bacterium]